MFLNISNFTVHTVNIIDLDFIQGKHHFEFFYILALQGFIFQFINLSVLTEKLILN